MINGVSSKRPKFGLGRPRRWVMFPRDVPAESIGAGDSRSRSSDRGAFHEGFHKTIGKP